METNKFRSSIFKLLDVTVDIFLVNLGLWLTHITILGIHVKPVNLHSYLFVIPLISVITIVLFDIYGLYRTPGKSCTDVACSIGLSLLFLEFSTAVAAFFIRGLTFPRSVIVVAPVYQFILLAAWKYTMWRFQRMSHGTKGIALLGKPQEVRKVLEKVFNYAKEQYSTLYIDCILDRRYIRKVIDRVNEVFICPGVNETLKVEIVSLCVGERKKAYIVPQLYDILLSRPETFQLDDVPVFQLTSLELTIEQKVVKRFFDLVISLVGLVVSAPVMLLIALAVKVDSRGPVFYLQERVTRKNKVFKLIKFRTMVHNAENLSGPVLSTSSDARVTKVGRFIRAIRFDELPQFINVLAGDMSFVGPRPERQFFIDRFISEIPNYMYRHNVKAGITGMAQVHGGYSTNAADKLRYDLMYIKNYSFLLDLKIILQTLRILFVKKSSKGIDAGKLTDNI